MVLHRMLFIFGAAMASAQFIPGLPAPFEFSLLPSGCPPTSEMAPVICKFMQQNLAFPYKPQLIAPSTYIPPLVLEKCDTPKLEMEIEIAMPVEERKPIIIPEAPVLPPITLPKFPVPVMVEEPVAKPMAEPCEPAFVPEMPVVTIPVAPGLPMPELPAFHQILEVPEVKEPLMIPQPPELSNFVMPELLVGVAEQPMIIEPCPEEQPMHVISVPQYIQPATIPAAPELPVFSEMVELPKVETLFKPVEIPQPPGLPAFVMPELHLQAVEQTMISAPCPEDKVTEFVPVPELVKPLAPIPEAPELFPAVLPELPVRLDLPQPIVPTVLAEEPCVTGDEPKVEPVFISKPSIVPEFIVPEPFNMEIRNPFTVPVLPAYLGAAVNADPCEPSAQPIVKMADLPPYFVRNAPYVFGKERFLSLPYMTRF